jgi:hypothetical protein
MQQVHTPPPRTDLTHDEWHAKVSVFAREFYLDRKKSWMDADWYKAINKKRAQTGEHYFSDKDARPEAEAAGHERLRVQWEADRLTALWKLKGMGFSAPTEKQVHETVCGIQEARERSAADKDWSRAEELAEKVGYALQEKAPGLAIAA